MRARQLLEDAFWCYFWEEQELTRLEAALISGNASAKLSKEMMKEKWKLGENEIRSPYAILNEKAYVRMKLPFLDDDEKRSLIQCLLKDLTIEGELYSPDYRVHPKDYRLAIDLLHEKLDVQDNAEKQVNIRSPIMNFQFYDKEKKVDFSEQSLVKNFSMFVKNPKKKKWLQKCLSLGLPIFPYIPFNKLGFEVKNIL